MRIKRVEIIGFKSFCDRAVVQIGEAITGVVGPNGCGKSNIVDAIRWCMGEQSAKHLRGKAMEDVIFAGSESRGPAPMAEVSLTFDDVGFSHETLELARNSDEAGAEQALEMLVPEGDADAAGPAPAGDPGPDAAMTAGPDAAPPSGPDAAPEAAPPSGPDAAPEARPSALWVDADGFPIQSPMEEAAAVLADQPPVFDFARYTEVTITRRLYRDGISQYFINKTPCRLRDVTDFFLGTGVGTKAYAIIEQGRIGQIVSSRPQDRRAIIEEAAGITKFKAKKKAAEKKLDQTRQNLMRVSDIVVELDKRMGTLRRQAQKAERYRKYKTEVRDIELWKASHRWLELTGEGQLVAGRLGAARTEREDLQNAWASKDAHVVTERAELAVEERRLHGIEHGLHELDNRLRLGESKIGFERREAEELDGRIAGARGEIDDIAAQRASGAAELAERQGELSALEAEVARESAEVEAREAAAGEAKQMLVNAEGRLDEARGELATRRTEIATADAQLEALGRRRDEASRRLERVVTETEQHTARLKELEREGRRVDGALAELRQTRLDLGNQTGGFEARRELLADETARGEAEVETLRTELHRRTSRLTSLREIQERYEGFARGTRAVMQRADEIAESSSSIHGVVADVVRAPELLEVAVEAALGDRLGGVLVSEPEVGIAAIGFLKQGGGGRSAFVPMTQDLIVADAVPEPIAGSGSGHSGHASLGSLAGRFEGEGNSDRWHAPSDAASEPPVEPRGDASLEPSEATGDRAAEAAADPMAGAAADPMAGAARNPAAEPSREVASDAPAEAAGDLSAEVTRDLSALATNDPMAEAAGGAPAEAAENASVDAVGDLSPEAASDLSAEAAGPAWATLAVPPVETPFDAAAGASASGSGPELVAGDEAPEARVAVAAPDTGLGRRASTPSWFEDRTQLVAAHAAIGGEGVLGRMADLVAFSDGYESVGRRLLAGTVVVDDLARALELHKRGVADRLVTLDGDVVDHDGVVAGGSRDAQGAGVLAQKREIRDLEEIVGRLEHDLSEAMARLVTAKTELKQVGKALDGLRTQAHEGEIAIMGHEKDESRVRGELERIRERLGQLGLEQLELEERLRAIGLDEHGNRDRRSAAVARIDELERAQLDTLSEVAANRDRLAELADLLTEARIRAAQLTAQRAAAETATLRLQRTDAELAARAERLAAEIEEAANRAAALRESCEQLAAELAIVREQRDGDVRALDDGRRAYDVRLSALTEVELAARDLRGRADKLGSEVGQLELRDGQIKMTRQVVEDQISERYQLEVTSILHDYHLRPAVTETEEHRLTELRELIERMGTDINLTAIEEYAEVSQRFEFLSAQKNDLERAVDQLQRAIDKINRTSRKLFKDTFDAVNATFKEVFPRLFRGGNAALSLTAPNERGGAAAGEGGGPETTGSKSLDLLEAGIEILAQPPGKKNSTVEQLSGGEKALTAVALVFSIFLIKPSPFCILDEVDAPLDEANVDRYNELVREMTDRSQFIVITHNKRTMESADGLYGVTMQEPGVSKLVSVNLSRLGRTGAVANQSNTVAI